MLLLIPLCLAFAGVFLWQELREKYVGAVVLKGLASLCFVLLGVLGSPGTPLARLIVAGLVLGCVADVLLNLRWVFEKKGQLIFLVGILVFLAGHVLYLAAVLPLCENRLVCCLLGAVLTALLMIWIFKRISAKTAFKIFGVVYVGAVVLLNCVAVSNLIAAPSVFTALFASGALFRQRQKNAESSACSSSRRARRCAARRASGSSACTLISTPHCFASFSAASAKLKPSIFITNLKASPLSPHPKQWK